MGALLNPTHGVRDEMLRAGLSPKNHQSDNVRRLRDLEHAMREKRSAAEIKSKEAWSPESKNVKYAHVPSAVARTLAQRASPRERPSTAPPRSPRPPSSFVLGRVTDSKPVFLSTPLAEVETPRARKPAVPLRSDAPATPRTPRGQEKDFIGENIRRAETARPRTAGARSARADGPFRTPEQAAAPLAAAAAADARRHHHHDSFGALPKYLVARKLEMALERERKAQEAETRRFCPPGTRLLPEAERLEALAALERNSAEVVAALQRLPLHPHTLSQKKAKADLEAKAKGIADALLIFGRSRVVVEDK